MRPLLVDRRLELERVHHDGCPVLQDLREQDGRGGRPHLRHNADLVPFGMLKLGADEHPGRQRSCAPRHNVGAKMFHDESAEKERRRMRFAGPGPISSVMRISANQIFIAGIQPEFPRCLRKRLLVLPESFLQELPIGQFVFGHKEHVFVCA